MNILIALLAAVGVLSITFLVYLVWLPINTIDNEPEYTEEEQFYASLLQQKSDLDADAFATRKAMLDEFLRHNNGQ